MSTIVLYATEPYTVYRHYTSAPRCAYRFSDFFFATQHHRGRFSAFRGLICPQPLSIPVVPPENAARWVHTKTFGWAVSIDGDYAIVGAPGHENHRGAAYIFRCKDTEWVSDCRLDPSHEYRSSNFGWSVSICGDYAMVGTSSSYSEPGCAYIFRRGEKTWTQQIKLAAPEAASGDKFEQSVSINRYYAAAGAPWFSNWPGRVYIFQRDAMTWTQQAKLNGSPAGKGMDSFGCSVSIGTDCAIVGGIRTESAYVFGMTK